MARYGRAANRRRIALTLFIVSVVLATATVSNDNLQDLKTGYLVGATPWRQQVVLVVGCVVGALVIPPVLELPLQTPMDFRVRWRGLPWIPASVGGATGDADGGRSRAAFLGMRWIGARC